MRCTGLARRLWQLAAKATWSMTCMGTTWNMSLQATPEKMMEEKMMQEQVMRRCQGHLGPWRARPLSNHRCRGGLCLRRRRPPHRHRGQAQWGTTLAACGEGGFVRTHLLLV